MSDQPATGPSLGLDIGGTKTHGIVLDPAGRVLAEDVRPTLRGPDGVVASALDTARDCLALAGLLPADLACVGVGIPGQVDHRSGLVRTAVNLGIERLDLGDRLEAELRVPVRVDNDVKAAALGAAEVLGVAAGDLTYVNFGTGVASASVVGGRLVRGEGNLAGEIGHIPVSPDGERCVCGQRGCLEVLAGGGRIIARLAGLAPRVTLANLVEAATAGDPDAVAEAVAISAGMATAIQLVVLTQGSAQVVLGGGVVRTGRGLVALVRQVLAERAAESGFLASLDLPGRVVELPAGLPVAAIGAALVARTAHPQALPAPIS